MKEAQSRKEGIAGICLERIHRLLELAEKESTANPMRSKRYVELARKISERNRVNMPRELKQKFCKKCNSMLIGSKAGVRKKKMFLNISCGECSTVKRVFLKKE